MEEAAGAAPEGQGGWEGGWPEPMIQDMPGTDGDQLYGGLIPQHLINTMALCFDYQ